MTYPQLNRRLGSGDEIRGQAGEDLGDRKVVYRAATGRWMLADADAATAQLTLGFTIGSIASGNFGRILLRGFVGMAGWTWTVGGVLYVSTVAGEITQTVPVPPARIQNVAVAYDANIIYFDPKDALTGIPVGCFTLEGSTAYVGFDSCKSLYTNYFYCDGVADDVQINLAEAYITTLGGGTVELERGTFTLADPIIPTGNDVWYKGQGSDTFLDGDGLATTEHVFHVTGRTDIKISDMSMQTEDGGGKTCHCIFIEDGSHRFLVENVSILASDDQGIRVEGTTMTMGDIRDCYITATDGDAIHIHTDAANPMYRLTISNNQIAAPGGAGIWFDATGGDYYSLIHDNTIYDAAGIGIYLAASNGTQINNNTIITSGLSGIHILSSTQMNITDNISNSNERHGIFLTITTDSIVGGNICNLNDVSNTATYDGICIDGSSDNNLILRNKCNDNDRYGISVAGTGNRIKENDFSGNTAGAFLDTGTNTELATKVFEFIAGGDVEGTATWGQLFSSTAIPKGWSISGAEDWAVALGQLPLELQEIVRIKIWGVALGAPLGGGGQMHLEIIMNAGVDDTPFTTEHVALANFDSETTDYINRDVVHWICDAGDDVDIGDMIAGMSIEFKVIYEGGAAPDGATNAVFRTVEVEYV